MTSEHLQALPACNLPNSNALIIAPTGQQISIWTERDGSHSSAVPLQNVYALLSLSIPDANAAVVAAADQQSSSRVKFEPPDTIGMSLIDRKSTRLNSSHVES